MLVSSRFKEVFPQAKASTKLAALPAEGRVLKEFEERFDTWDHNGNGQISWGEIRQSLADSSIKGKDSVALAAFYGLVDHDRDYRGLERRPPVSFERLGDLYYEYSDDDDRPMADRLYQKFDGKLRAASEDLFPQGLPNAHSLKQGTAPSCGFLSATFAHLLKDPHSVKNAITELDKGYYEVKFPGLDKAISVPPLTQAEKALFAGAESNGTWLAVLEKAWGIHQTKSDPLAAFEQTTYPEDAIEAWTNGKATTSRIPKQPNGYKKGELPDFLRTTHRELAANHLVVVWTRFDKLTQEDLVPGHAYTLTGVDYRDGTVTLRNPWGRQEPTDENGNAKDGVDDGLFEFPLAKFAENFGKVARQVR